MLLNQFARNGIRAGIFLGAMGALVVLLSVAVPVSAKSSPDSGTRIEQSPALNAPSKAASIIGLDDGGNLNSNDVALNLATELNAKWIRTSVQWEYLEPVKGTYNWTGADAAINPLVAKGFTPMVIFGDNPTWAANTHCGPIDTSNASLVDSFSSVLGALAARYPKVGMWVLYNEVDFDGTPSSHNGGCFGSRSAGGVNNNGKKDVDEYVFLLAKAWKAIHTANPSAKLGTGAVAFDNFNKATAPAGYPGGGSTSGFNYQFLSDLLGGMAANPRPAGDKFIDFIVFNYYDLYGTYYWKNVATGEGIQAKANAIRAIMTQKGIKGVKLFVGETGEDSYSNLVGLAGQARCLQITMTRAAAGKIRGVIWWTFKDFHDSAEPPRNVWKYGVVDQDNQRKPSYLAMKALIAELNGYKAKGTVSNTAGFTEIEAYRFLKQGNYKYVVWSSSIKNQSKKSNCSWDRNKRVVTFTATKIRTVNAKGKAKLILDNSPKDLNKTVGKVAVKVGAQPLIVQVNP